MNAAWLRGVRDLLNWVLGDRDNSPLRGVVVHQPPLCELDFEEEVTGQIA